MNHFVRHYMFLLAATTIYGATPFAVLSDSGIVNVPALVDASAMASSKINDNVIWVCNGHSDNNKFYAIDVHGNYIATFYLKVRWQRNWEDMASGPGPDPSKTYLYIADIGDNDAEWPVKTIYRFEEPAAIYKGENIVDTIKIFDKLDYSYPDTIRDAEAMMVDPQTKDYYVISKRESNGRVYCAPFPQPISSADTLMLLDSIPYQNINAADISASGEEILIKDYGRIYYWKRENGERIIDVLKRPAKKLPYRFEPCGEAVCWNLNASAYFTISEERDSIDCRLYRYIRNPTGIFKVPPSNQARPPQHWQSTIELPAGKTVASGTNFEVFDLSGRRTSDVHQNLKLRIHRAPVR